VDDLVVFFKNGKMKLLIAFLVFAVLVSLFYGFAIKQRHEAEMVMSQYVQNSQSTLIIDAGHGGADGGASSPSGTLESGINLQIAQRVDALTGLYGIPSEMTRTSEDIDYPADATTIRAKKVADTKARVELINSVNNAVLVSIHQNIYDSGSVSGPQVLYAGTTGSAEFAQIMQDTLAATLNPGKVRAPTHVSSDIYIMNHLDCTAILVECGFLSNAGDEANLKDSGYQVKIAASILSAYIASQDIFSGGNNEA